MLKLSDSTTMENEVIVISSEDKREEEEAARIEDESDTDTEPFPGTGYERRGDPGMGREYYRSREERPPPKLRHTIHRSSINIAERLDGCVMLKSPIAKGAEYYRSATMPSRRDTEEKGKDGDQISPKILLAKHVRGCRQVREALRNMLKIQGPLAAVEAREHDALGGVGDKGMQFTSKSFRSFMGSLGVELQSRPENPTERMNHNAKTMISQYVRGHQSSWNKLLPEITIAINSSAVDSMSFSPPFLLLEREPSLLAALYDEVTPG
ncbi:hypothetical protein AWZ03_014332 [Drosophila navojoa]|uniref:Integrase catalytic domain-containing protein n=1 Tax=Drosophila navojoa TaxID=7232 RepID=A0A484AUL8_DRONA|nr:hypothetical protein AWZ03_014332 [Drosophila navojoa]